MQSADTFAPLSGVKLLLAGFALALGNFMVVLDMTIANVATPHIAGSLGIASTQGTWVITSYAVAEAICVPLTGWLARRYGPVRVFTFGMIGFGLFSVLCGLSTTLGSLVVFRVAQGLCGGPIMPLSQILLMRIYPKEKHGQAMSLWAMTTVIAPILGPIMGGMLSDQLSWHWAFFINIPVAVGCAAVGFTLLRRAEMPSEKVRIDGIGLALLVIWIGALQLMLDLGREHDWFGSSLIVTLAVVAVLGFIAFLIWELTEDEPAVDLRAFRHRGFAVSMVALMFAFGSMFAGLVLIPQWLQTTLGYSATWSGYATAFNGVAAVIAAPIVGKLSEKTDPRMLIFFGILWMGVTSWLRVVWWSNDADFWTLALPQLIQGLGMPFFFIPLTTLALAAVDEAEATSAAGVMNFLRTIAGAIATPLALTLWSNASAGRRSDMSATLNDPEGAMSTLQAGGFSGDQARNYINTLVDQQASAGALNHMFLIIAFVFGIAAFIIWLAPRPTRQVDTSAVH